MNGVEAGFILFYIYCLTTCLFRCSYVCGEPLDVVLLYSLLFGVKSALVSFLFFFSFKNVFMNLLFSLGCFAGFVDLNQDWFPLLFKLMSSMWKQKWSCWFFYFYITIYIQFNCHVEGHWHNKILLDKNFMQDVLFYFGQNPFKNWAFL